jgi:hypothetical protein
MRTFKPTAVFLGPTLGSESASAILDADYYPPARKGDVYRIMTSGVQTIVLIDGVFHNTPSIWQRELLAAIEEGIEVFGASSMGALRAAELHPFGMIGYGTVFEWYRDGILDADDEVAVWHGPEECDFRPLSEPLVNIRYTLLKAVQDQCLGAEQAQTLIAYAKRLHYPDRSYRRLLDSPVLKGWSRRCFARLEEYLLSRSTDIKRTDAVGLLRHCARRGSSVQGRRKPTRRGMSGKRIRPLSTAPSDCHDSELFLWSGSLGAVCIVGGDKVLEEARKDIALVEKLRPVLSRRYFLLEWVRQNGVCCPQHAVAAFVAKWEKEHQIVDREAWLRANALTPRAYLALLAERALLEWITTLGPCYFGLRQSFVLEWASQNGVSRPSDCAGHDVRQGARASARALEAWIVRQGPLYFGRSWNLDVALLQELQITGRAAQLDLKLISAPSTEFDAMHCQPGAS